MNAIYLLCLFYVCLILVTMASIVFMIMSLPQIIFYGLLVFLVIFELELIFREFKNDIDKTFTIVFRSMIGEVQ